MGLSRILPEQVQVGFSPLKLLTRVIHLRGDVCPSYCLIREAGRERALPLEEEKGEGGGEIRKRRKEGEGEEDKKQKGEEERGCI